MANAPNKVIFSDVNPGVLETSPYELVYNEDAINTSLEMIFSTPVKSRPLRRSFGCLADELLFEPLDDTTARRVSKDFQDAVAQWENRITDVSVVMVPDYVNQQYYVSVTYTIPKLNNKVANYTFNVGANTAS